MLNNKYYSTYPCINIYERPSIRSKISSQIIYGDKKFNYTAKPTHKVKVLKTKIYKSNNFLPFSSEIEVLKRKKNYIMFKKNKWIKQKDITVINKKEKNFVKIFKLYLNCKYKWGGKTFEGIDCSALVQLFYKFNNKFFPRDTVDQIKMKKGVKKKNLFDKGDIIFWKGHVAVCLNSNLLIHAYGPRKKVVIMPIKKTIDLIEKTAKLKIKKVVKI